MKNKMKEYEDLYSSPAAREAGRRMGERMRYGNKLLRIFETFGEELIGKRVTILVPEFFGPNFNYGDTLTIDYVEDYQIQDQTSIEVGFVEISHGYDVVTVFAPLTGKLKAILNDEVELAAKLSKEE